MRACVRERTCRRCVCRSCSFFRLCCCCSNCSCLSCGDQHKNQHRRTRECGVSDGSLPSPAEKASGAGWTACCATEHRNHSSAISSAFMILRAFSWCEGFVARQAGLGALQLVSVTRNKAKPNYARRRKTSRNPTDLSDTPITRRLPACGQLHFIS